MVINTGDCQAAKMSSVGPFDDSPGNIDFVQALSITMVSCGQARYPRFWSAHLLKVPGGFEVHSSKMFQAMRVFTVASDLQSAEEHEW